jgi:outer membrane lipoprotein-sorting protein
MFKSTALAAALLSLSALAQASDVASILKKADAFRQTDSSAQIETLVQTYKNGEPDKEKRYEVLIRPGGKSLILFRSRRSGTEGADVGRRFLDAAAG